MTIVVVVLVLFLAGLPISLLGYRAFVHWTASGSQYQVQGRRPERLARLRLQARASQRKRTLADFRPPRPSKALIHIFKQLLTEPVLFWIYRTMKPTCSAADVERLRVTTASRTLLIPNHPTKGDPVTAFWLSGKCDRLFYMVSNREQFRGFYGRMLQALGAYSLKRGTHDRESFVQTNKLLSDKSSNLVIFAEGGTYSTATEIAPLQDAVFKMALGVLDRIDTEGDKSPFYIQPLTFSYWHPLPMVGPIQVSLDRLEAVVGAELRPESAPRDRILAIAECVIKSAEASLGLRQPTTATLCDRSELVFNALIRQVDHLLGGPAVCDHQDNHSKIRALLNKFSAVQCSAGKLETEYDANLLRQDFELRMKIRYKILRLERWISLRQDYLGGDPSIETLIDIIQRLELEVFGRIKLRGYKACNVSVPEAIDLRSYLTAFRSDPDATAHELALLVEESLRRGQIEFLRLVSKEAPTTRVGK